MTNARRGTKNRKVGKKRTNALAIADKISEIKPKRKTNTERKKTSRKIRPEKKKNEEELIIENDKVQII